MTRPNALVLDGDTIKHRLQALHTETKSAVHVDWLRFTVQRRFCEVPSVDALFPLPDKTFYNEADLERYRALSGLIQMMPGHEYEAAAQAWDLAGEVVEVLGPDFSVSKEVLKGHDFYRFRWSIIREGAECGWVGYLSSSSSPRQTAQGRTIHVNLYGMACTFAQVDWRERMADLCDRHEADLTRIDLALDFFNGFAGGLDRVVNDYKAGLLDVGGRRLKVATVGDWINGRERSFYVGSKEAGKQTNVYEKGDQLYGVEAGSPWIRAELRYGNKLRVLPVDMLRRPADFFAGASDYHAELLRMAGEAENVSPSVVTCTGRLQAETVEAEVTRNLRWCMNVAAPSLAVCFRHLTENAFLDLVSGTQLPGRLRRFASGELQRAFDAVVNASKSLGAGPAVFGAT